MSYDVNKLGDHDALVESVEFSENQAGDCIINLRFRFPDGEIGNKDLYPFSSERSLEITRKSLKAMGFNMDKDDLSVLVAKPDTLKGKKVRLVCEEHEYKGHVTNRISWINEIREPAKASSLKTLTEKLRNVKKENLNDSL